MSRRSLQNYLRTYRKRTGLSQDDVAYLLGCRSSSKICRCERHRRIPNLETALAYEIIFRVPVRDLFKGVFERVEHRIMRQVGLLGRKLQQAPGQDRRRAQKLDALAVVIREAKHRGNGV